MNEPDKESSQREESQRRALLLDPDLFFAVKVSATLKHLGFETVTARQLNDWKRRLESERFDLALVNTAARGVEWATAITAARDVGLPLIAYGSHVDTEAQALARAAGATRVIANSRLAADLPTIVEQTLRRARASTERAAAEPAKPAPTTGAVEDDDA